MHTSKHIIDVNMVTYNFFFRVVAQKLKCFIILKIIHYKHLEEGKHTFSFLVFICCARFAISLHCGLFDELCKGNVLPCTNIGRS